MIAIEFNKLHSSTLDRAAACCRDRQTGPSSHRLDRESPPGTDTNWTALTTHSPPSDTSAEEHISGAESNAATRRDNVSADLHRTDA